MTDKNDRLDLGVGSVPDPFGLAWEHERHADEAGVDTGDTGSDTSDDTATVTAIAGAGGTTETEPDEQPVRLGELD